MLHGPAQARERGIAVVHQEPRLFPDLTVAENVFSVTRLAARSASIGAPCAASRPRSSPDSGSAWSRAIVQGLSMADQQLIEIAKALSIEARVLILDEPTASLSAHEVERLFAIVRQTRARGVAVLFVSHRLDEVFDLCDSATVLRDGKHVVTAATRITTPADLIRHMVGRAVTLFPKVDAPIGDVLLQVDGLSRGEAFRDVRSRFERARSSGQPAWSARAGPRVARVLFGIDRADAGEIASGARSSRSAARRRAPTGSHTCRRTATRTGWSWTSMSNVTPPILPRLFPRLLIQPGIERKIGARYIDRLRIRATGVDQLASALSGGNQQKVVLGKWLASEPRVLILDEPTMASTSAPRSRSTGSSRSSPRPASRSS